MVTKYIARHPKFGYYLGHWIIPPGDRSLIPVRQGMVVAFESKEAYFEYFQRTVTSPTLYNNVSFLEVELPIEVAYATIENIVAAGGKARDPNT